eukprot:20781-Rhodomonas_salina.3
MPLISATRCCWLPACCCVDLLSLTLSADFRGKTAREDERKEGALSLSVSRATPGAFSLSLSLRREGGRKSSGS